MENKYVENIFTISTAHVKEEVMWMLDNDANNLLIGYGLLAMRKSEFGYTIWCGDRKAVEYEKYSVPEELYNCMIAAVDNGCEWLCLDCDGMIYDGLKTFEW